MMANEHLDSSYYDKSTKIYRYMNFNKFFLLLRDESLYFHRLDKYKADPSEGTPTNKTIELCSEGGPSKFYDLNIRPSTKDELDNLLAYRQRFFINCWNSDNGESIDMWKEYASDSTGICIQSNFNSLKKCFVSSEISDQYKKYFNFISYVNREKAVIIYPHVEEVCIPNKDDFIHLLWAKDMSYIHENEIRAVIEFDQAVESGINAKVSLDILLEKVLVRKNAPDWFFNLIKSLIAKHGLDPNIVNRSCLVD
jgi:hypothetical protein